MAAYALAQNALIDLATVLGELGLASDPAGTPVTRRINGASHAIERYLGRSLWWSERAEVYGSGGNPGDSRISLKSNPIWPPVGASVIEVQLDLDPTEYESTNPFVFVQGKDFYVESYSKGLLFRAARWPTTAIRRGDIVQDWSPNEIELDTQVTYLCGYVTPVAIAAALTAWPGASTSPAGGTLLCPASQPNQVWGLTPTTVPQGSTGSTEPSWPASPAQFATQTDGTTTWTFLGWGPAVATNPQAATLPYDIQQAAIDTVVTWYRRKGSSLEPTASKFGDASQTYGARLGLPTPAIELLRPYRRIVVG